MSNFYIKNKEGKYLPVELTSLLSKDMDGHLIIVKVGTDDHPATADDLDLTEESFACADVLNDLEDVSVIITSYNVDIGAVPKDELEEKNLYIQITGNDSIGNLGEQVKNMYKRLKRKFDTVVLPSPLKIKDYNKVQDILRRNKIRKDRRGRTKG